MYDVAMENSVITHEYWQAPDEARLQGTVSVQGSKSVAQRVLFNAFLSTGESRLAGAPDCGDFQVFCQALKDLGGSLRQDDLGDWLVSGLGSAWSQELAAEEVELQLESNGTAMRFLTALCALRPGRTVQIGRAHV